MKGTRPGKRTKEGTGIRFLDFPQEKYVPAIHITLDRSSATWKLTERPMGRCRVDWATYYTRTKELRRPDLKKVARRAMIAEVVARHRAILLAEGKLVFPLRAPGEDPDEPWEGVPCTHLNDDRRIPLLWTKGGVAQTLVNPNEPFWYSLEDCSVVPGGKMFKDLATLDEMGPEMRAKYQHCGLVP